MSLRKINDVLKKAVIEYNSKLTAEQLTEEFRKVHRIQDALIAKAKICGDNCDEAVCYMNFPSEDSFEYLDVNGWIEPAVDTWNIIGELIFIPEFDIADMWMSKVIPFLDNYMNSNYEDYKKDDSGSYRFSTAIRGSTDDWDTYTEVEFLPFEYVCIMLQLETM